MSIGIILLIIFFFILSNFNFFSPPAENVDYSTFIHKVVKGDVKQVKFIGEKIEFIDIFKRYYNTYTPYNDPNLVNILLKKNIIISGEKYHESHFLTSVIISWVPMILLIGIWIFFMRQIYLSTGKDGAMMFGKNKSRMLEKNEIKINFSDVAGCDEAKEEVSELVEYLKEPNKFKKIGGKIPQGILMVGPPGTGKTLLAQAIAGEAKVPFFTVSGSDFVEMFVGVGAARVRDMFANARKFSPCIIFIDEIDSIGRNRGSGFGHGNEEREQTLNQMLVEMDGFESNKGIIIIAATNRQDILDPALLRPGRFDRQVFVSLPDVLGRSQILKVHIKKIPISKDFDPLIIARGTPGFSGADLAHLVNEAALCAVRDNRKIVNMLDFERSKDKIIMGLEKTSKIMSDFQKESTAYHESGHVIVGKFFPEHDPVHKVTIIPRGSALGVTVFLPKEDIFSVSKKKLESKIATLYGGRIAEEIIYGWDNVSTGASKDIEMATKIARNMVTKWGLSDKLGPVLYTKKNSADSESYKITAKNNNFSEETARIIDEEIKHIVDINYRKAKKILQDNLDILHSMKDALIKYETIDALQINDLIDRKKVRKPKNWSSL
ncbi:ATP-dependent zinc metalloprotease FtsH [Buchnera aphidicola]|uniref:ATP-dependent zinc metalloprotease FtsH n=1 Tax=Buchnera aphidicola TaxID=9 RepID=UPI0030EB3C69